MSQVFAADSVNNVAGGTAVNAAETPVVTGNFLSPPFQNAKGVVFGQLQFSANTGATSVQLRLRRNPNGENAVVGVNTNLSVTVGASVLYSFCFADVIPDGRAVQYQLTVQQPGASANGSYTLANITTILISG